MDKPLERLAQACGIRTTGDHEWPAQVDEDIAEFISSMEPRAIFVVEQNDGLIIGPPPRSNEDTRVMVIAKPKGALPSDNWDQHVVSAAMPLADGVVFKHLHSLLAQAVLPIFDSRAGTASAQARHRLVEAERALAQLLRHTQVAFVELTSGALATRVQKALDRINEESESGNKEASASDLNELQSVVNIWKQQVSQLASSDRDVREGSVSDEVGFWIALEAALHSVQEQLSSPMVTEVWKALERNKRFHATHNFGGETGLTEALTRAQGYTQLLFRDLPIGEMLAASSLEQLVDSTESVFLHINRKLRASGYPAQRSVAFAEAIGRDFCSVLAKITENEIEHAFDSLNYGSDYIQNVVSDIRNLKRAVVDAAEIWDTQVRDFATVARDLMRRRAERFIVVKVETAHTSLVSRITALDALCMKHAELIPLLQAASVESTALDDTFRSILQTKNLLQLDDDDWNKIETQYAREAHFCEKRLAEKLFTELSQAQNDETELFDVFSRHQSVMARPEVRVVAHKFQNTILETIRRDFKAAERRSRELPKAEDQIVERVVRMNQIRLRAVDIKNRLSIVLGPEWRDHSDGAQVGSDCDILESKMDIKHDVDGWVKHVAETPATHQDHQQLPIFSISGNMKLIVSESNATSQNSLRSLKALGFRFDPSLSTTIDLLVERHVASTRLTDCLASIDSLIDTIRLYPRIKPSNEIVNFSHQVMAFVRLGLNEVTWDSLEISNFVYGFEHAISLLESKVYQLAQTDASISEVLSAPNKDVQIMKTKIDDILDSVLSPEYQKAVREDLSSVVSKKISEVLDGWTPSRHYHSLEFKNRSIQVTPHITNSLVEWFNELNALTAPAANTQADFSSSYSSATSKIWQSWEVALAEIDHWIEYQSLWDLDVDEVITNNANNIQTLFDILDELRLSRERSFGGEHAINLDISGFQMIFESKCDSWQNALMNSLANGVCEKSTESLDLSRKARRDVETSRLDFTGLLVGIQVSGKAKSILENVKQAVPTLFAAQSLLNKLRFDFPSNWVPIEHLEDELVSLDSVVQRRELDLKAAKPRLLKELESRTASLVGDVDQFRERWMANKPLQPHIDPDQALKSLDRFSMEVQGHSNLLTGISEAFTSLDGQRPLPLKLQGLSNETKNWLEEIEVFRLGWLDIGSGWHSLRDLGSKNWFSIDPAALVRDVRASQERINDFPDRTKQLRAYARLMEHLKLCTENLEKITALRQSDAIEYRHLTQLVPSIAAASKDTVRLSDVWTKLPVLSVVYETVETAEGEYQLLKYIDTVNSKWLTTSLSGHDGAIYNLDTILQQARDHLAAFNAMRASAHFPAVAASVQDWERRVGSAQQVFDKFIDVQRQYMYLRGVLTSAAVIAVLPSESRRFKGVADEFDQIYLKTLGRPALEVAGLPRLSSNLARLVNQFASLYKSLSGFLESQRQRFPRLYFVGDEDLLEIVGSPIEVWGFKYLPLIFPGVSQLKPQHVISSEGDILKFTEPLELRETKLSNVEILICLEKRISSSLRSTVNDAIDNLKNSWPDPSKFGQWLTSIPVQAALLALREQWTRHMMDIKCGIITFEEYNDQYSSILQWLASSGDDSLLWARRRESVIAQLTHSQGHLQPEFPDLLVTLELSKEISTGGSSLILRRGTNAWPYGYEYLGALEPVVQTQVTDDMFLSATSAIAQEKGGNIIGPAGTGKTETVKALGALFGRRVIVFNCDNQFDFLTVARVMSGSAATNSWVCFDEFNRLSRGVLSSVAQIVSDGVRKAPVFVTMNPGYTGRTVLPPNMRDQFREFVLENPDAKNIARVLLCSHGKVSPEVADATVELLDFMNIHCSKQRHYDWGLRALKGVLRVCRLLHGQMRSACDIAIRPRLIPEDKAAFDTEIDRLLPSEKSHGAPTAEINSLSAMKDGSDYEIESQLRPHVESLSIFCKLFPGVMLLGPSGSGKSTVRETFAKSLHAETLVVNPAAVTKATLLGKLDPITREWTDGLLSGLLRKVSNNLRGEQTKEWLVVFDGEIEPDWAESLNSVLDDNRHLTLSSGEILMLPPQVHFIFETTNLNSATPATVSRCGMICLPAYDANKASPAIPINIMNVANQIDHSMEFMESGAIMTYLKLDLGSPWLNMVWALAGDSNEAGRITISEAIRSFPKEETVPEKGSLTDYYVSDLTGRWHSWNDSVGDCKDLTPDAMIRPDVVIPTAETISHEAILQTALNSHLPLLLVGPPGSGKTMTLFNALRQIQQVMMIPLNFSSTATLDLVVQALEMHCELSVGNDGTKVLSPPGSKWAVLFIDEINLPQPRDRDISDVVPVLQFLRYMIEYKGFLNASGEFIKLERVQLVGACNPPPQRRPLPSSLLRHLMVIRVDYPSTASLHTIYDAFSSTFGAKSLVEPMLKVYEKLPEVLPNETWTPRELTRWMRGIYSDWTATSESQQNSKLLAELWVYEACRVLSDRLETASKIKIHTLLAEYHPSAPVDLSEETLGSNVWTALVAQRPKFVHINEIRHFLEARLNVFVEEASGEADNSLIVHHEFAQHVVRVERVLRQSQGHALLVGPPSVGKTSVIRFASWLVGLDLKILRSHSRYGDADFAQDLRRVLIRAIRRPICLLLGDDLLSVPEFVERMNSLLANGEVPGLFENPEQFSELEEACRRSGFNGGDLVPWFRSRTVQNLHIMFTTADVTSASPALLNRCVVNRVEPWSSSVKLQIAEHWCSNTDVGSNLVIALASLPPPRFSKYNSNSGMAFIEACRQFVTRYNDRKFELEESQRHFVGGSDRLKSTVLEIGQLKRHLANQQKQLAQEDQRSSEVLSQMLREQSEAERKRVAAVEIRAALQAQTSEIENRQNSAHNDLAATEPLIQQAAEGVQNIKKSQLNELRSLMNPPEPVKITLEAVCLVLGLQTDGSWKQVLAAVRGDEFIPRIVNFDSGRLTNTLISKIEREYMSIPSFTYERVDRASKAGGPLLRWVVAQVAYGRAIAAVQPLLIEIEKLNEQSSESKAQLDAIETMLRELETAIEHSKREYGNTVAHCEVLKAEMQHVASQLTRAETLLSSLSEEKERWASASQEFPENMALLAGKALMEASLIAISGRLDPGEKQILVQEVQELAETHSIKTNEDFVSVAMGSDSNQQIIENSRAVVLVVDPENRWNPECFANSNLKVTSFLLDPDTLIKEVDAALRFGQSLVIQHSERFDPLITPLLTRDYARKGSRLFVNLGNGDIDVAPGFRLLLHARSLPNLARSAPLLLSRVNMVDYSVSVNKFEHMVGDALLYAQMPELAKRRSELQNVDIETTKKLRDLERKLLTALAESSATEKLLDNQSLVHSLETLKAETTQLKNVKSSTMQTLIELDDAFKKFSPLAHAASLVYRGVKSLTQIDGFYNLGVDWLWDIVEQLVSGKQFTTRFASEVRSRVMAVTKLKDWKLIPLISEANIPESDMKEAMPLVEIINETKPTIPIIAGMATTNTADPAAYISARTDAHVSVVAMGSSQSIVRADRLLSYAMDNGEWLIIQNIEIANEDWLRSLARRLQISTPSSRFRLILTGLQAEIVSIPDLIASGRPVLIERQHGVKHELLDSLTPESSLTDFMVCWVHSCFAEKFADANFSRGDLAAARWFVNNTPIDKGLKQALLTAVWAARTGNKNQREVMGRFINDTFDSSSILPQSNFETWASKLPDEPHWLPKGLDAIDSIS